MRVRLLFCILLALAGIGASQIWGAEDLSDMDLSFSDRKPTPRPAEVHGWVLLRVCSITGKLDHRYTEWAYVKPGFIVGIGNPPTSPDPCVAIHGSNGKRLFVEGSLEGIAQLVTEETSWQSP
jgi:hypothetical protein